MPLDLDRFELDSDDESDLDGWCNDFGNIGLPTQRIVHNVGRSLDEIMELEVRLINSCTDLDPITWINNYAEKFRKIMDADSSGTESQIKRKLYLNE